MKVSMVCGVVVLSACAADEPAKVVVTQQASTQRTISHQVQIGRDAALNWAVSAQTSASLDAFEVATRGPTPAPNDQATLSFGTFTYDPSTGYYSSSFTFAQLPAGALYVSPDDRTASLNLTTGPDAVTYTCTGQIGVSSTCYPPVPSSPLTFAVAWSSDGQFQSFFSGVSRNSMPGFISQAQGTATNNSARVSGTVAGTELPAGVTAWINDTNNTTVTRDVSLAN